MKINCEVWAIMPEYASVIETITNAQDQKTPDAFLKRGNVAVIPVNGVLIKGGGFSFSRQLASTTLIKRQVAQAVADPEIDGMMLMVDSPGGMVDGTKELADYIYQARQIKPIMTYADGLMASGALWLGSASSMVIASNETDLIGSIGVITEHYDISKMYENHGIKKTYLYAGKYKAAGNEAEPLNEENKNYMQGIIDGIYTIFIDAVARNLGRTPDYVRAEMADGRVFLAGEALRVGLIHGIASFDKALGMLGGMIIDKKLSALNQQAQAVMHKFKGGK